MNTPSYAKRIAQYISVERWLFDWNEVRSGSEQATYRLFVSKLFLDESSIRPHQRVRLLLGLEKKIVEVLIDCRTHPEVMQSEMIELIFIAEIDFCLDTNSKL